MSVLFYPESIRILGSDANGNNVILCEMAVDDIANLPAANAFISDGYVLSMGCKAIVINDNSKHRLNGSGNWVQIAAGTSTYTRAEIDALLQPKITLEDCFGAGVQITANGTVDITQLGKFYCANGATAATVTNAPWTDSGFFGYTQRSISASARYVQIAYRNDDSFQVAKRRYTGIWQQWSYLGG